MLKKGVDGSNHKKIEFNVFLHSEGLTTKNHSTVHHIIFYQNLAPFNRASFHWCVCEYMHVKGIKMKRSREI